MRNISKRRVAPFILGLLATTATALVVPMFTVNHAEAPVPAPSASQQEQIKKAAAQALQEKQEARAARNKKLVDLYKIALSPKSSEEAYVKALNDIYEITGDKSLKVYDDLQKMFRYPELYPNYHHFDVPGWLEAGLKQRIRDVNEPSKRQNMNSVVCSITNFSGQYNRKKNVIFFTVPKNRNTSINCSRVRTHWIT